MIPPSTVIAVRKSDGRTSRAADFVAWSPSSPDGNYYVSRVNLLQCAGGCGTGGDGRSKVATNLKASGVEVQGISADASKIAPVVCLRRPHGEGYEIEVESAPAPFDANLAHGYQFGKRGLMNEFNAVRLVTPSRLVGDYVARTERDTLSEWCDPNMGRYAYDFVMHEDDQRSLCLRVYMKMTESGGPLIMSQLK
jgi:hypothetical protein